MPMDRHARPDPLADQARQPLSRFGAASANRIYHHHLFRACFNRAQVNLTQECQLRARTVDSKEGNMNPALRSVTDRLLDPADELLGRDAVGAQLDCTRGRFNYGIAQTEPHQFVNVSPYCPRETPHFSFQTSTLDESDGFSIF